MPQPDGFLRGPSPGRASRQAGDDGSCMRYGAIRECPRVHNIPREAGIEQRGRASGRCPSRKGISHRAVEVPDHRHPAIDPRRHGRSSTPVGTGPARPPEPTVKSLFIKDLVEGLLKRTAWSDGCRCMRYPHRYLPDFFFFPIAVDPPVVKVHDCETKPELWLCRGLKSARRRVQWGPPQCSELKQHIEPCSFLTSAAPAPTPRSAVARQHLPDNRAMQTVMICAFAE